MNTSSTSLDGKTVAVIGGASGVGFAVAAAARDAGARVVVASSQAANVEAGVAELGRGVSGDVVDVGHEASVAAFFERLGAFDHLAFTAGDWGGSLFDPARDVDLTAAQSGMKVRFWGALAAVKYGCRTIAQDGSITLTGGMLAHRPMKGAPVTTAIAGAVEFLTQGLAVDLAPVRVNAVCLGIVLTERTKTLPDEVLTNFTARQPLARGGDPAEAAQAYLYAMRAGYTTGQVLRVDGGGSLV
jgi:NAD(P)-dependent dehydrogenase (short-subunit alcohol dehydrogenase family)